MALYALLTHERGLWVEKGATSVFGPHSNAAALGLANLNESWKFQSNLETTLSWLYTGVHYSQFFQNQDINNTLRFKIAKRVTYLNSHYGMMGIDYSISFRSNRQTLGPFAKVGIEETSEIPLSLSFTGVLSFPLRKVPGKILTVLGQSDTSIFSTSSYKFNIGGQLSWSYLMRSSEDTPSGVSEHMLMGLGPYTSVRSSWALLFVSFQWVILLDKEVSAGIESYPFEFKPYPHAEVSLAVTY